MKLGQKRVQRNFNPSATCNSISDSLLSTSTTTFINQLGEATLVETNVLEDSIEMIYEETSNIISSVYPILTPEKIHFKIVFSCVDGKWNRSERIYGKKIEGFSYFESEQQDKCVVSGEYCECKSICNEYENKTCKGVEKRKTNKTKKMKNYKVEIFDENTFKSKGIVDTKIPEILVKTIQESLDNLNENLVRTPLVLNEEELTPSFGIMVKDKKGLHHLKYRVNISLFNKPKKIKK